MRNRSKVLISIFSVIAAFFTISCTPETFIYQDTASITVNTGTVTSGSGSRAVISDVSSFLLTVTAAGMETVERSFTEQTVNLEISAGTSRTFTLEALDSSGNSIFSGSTTTDLTAGTAVTLNIEMDYSGFYVNFVTNGAGSLPVQYIEAGGLITVPGPLSRNDYTLTGWYTDSSLTSGWNLAADTVSQDMTLYAKWTDQHLNYIEFDGINDFISADSICNALAGNGTITIECSIYPLDLSIDQYFIAFNGSDYSNNLQMGTFDTNGNLKIYNPNLGSTVDSGNALSVSSWYHTALTIDESNNVTFYLDGSPTDINGTSYGSAFSVSAGDKFSIGQEWDSGPAASNFYKGYIDDIRIWSTVRTQAEIQNNIDRPLAGTEAGLVAYYECSDTAGGILTDSTVNGHDGTIEILYTVTYNSNGGSAVSSETGIYSGSVATEPADPTLSGYAFAGWYTDDGVWTDQWDFVSDTVTSDITLNAYWVPLYSFTNAGATGRQGPDQSQVDTAYSGTALDSSVTVTATGIQQWTVPATGTYRIEAYGASGANASTYGLGAVMKGSFTLTAGDVLWILAGQAGEGSYAAYAQIGGGGGSYVSTGATLSGSSLLIVAGGGGAAGASANTNANGSTSTSGNSGYNGGSNTALNAGGTGGNAGGVGGDGVDDSLTYGMDAAAGVITAGTSSQTFFDGGLGSQVISGASNGDGGFGGGGSSSTSGYASSGGGGGYSGGGASDSTNGMPFYGGGGGSYNTGTDQDNISGGNSGHGTVKIFLVP